MYEVCKSRYRLKDRSDGSTNDDGREFCRLIKRMTIGKLTCMIYRCAVKMMLSTVWELIDRITEALVVGACAQHTPL
jgi:hypothetical protein